MSGTFLITLGLESGLSDVIVCKDSQHGSPLSDANWEISGVTHTRETRDPRRAQPHRGAPTDDGE